MGEIFDLILLCLFVAIFLWWEYKKRAKKKQKPSAKELEDVKEHELLKEPEIPSSATECTVNAVRPNRMNDTEEDVTEDVIQELTIDSISEPLLDFLIQNFINEELDCGII